MSLSTRSINGVDQDGRVVDDEILTLQPRSAIKGCHTLQDIWEVLRKHNVEPIQAGSLDLDSFLATCVYFASIAKGEAYSPPDPRKIAPSTIASRSERDPPGPHWHLPEASASSHSSDGAQQAPEWQAPPPPDQEEGYTCFVCLDEVIYGDPQAFLRHILVNSYHDYSKTHSFPCPLYKANCQVVGRSIADMIDHMKEHASESGRSILRHTHLASKPLTDAAAAWNGGAFECYICHTLFSVHHDLELHLLFPAHVPWNGWYVCSDVGEHGCPAVFAVMQDLISHLESGKCGVRKFVTETVLVGPETSRSTIHPAQAGSTGSLPSRSDITVGLIYMTSNKPGVLNIGIAILPRHRGEGYARKALTHMLGWAFNEVHCHRVEASIPHGPHKHRVMDLFTKLGFLHEGTRRGAHSTSDGKWVDVIHFAMLATDWANRSYKTAPTSVWDQMILRHDLERHDLLRWDDSNRSLKRSASTETLRVQKKRRELEVRHSAEVDTAPSDTEMLVDDEDDSEYFNDDDALEEDNED